MKGHKIPDETRKTIYDRIATGDKIADIAADTAVAASTLRKNAAAGGQNPGHRSGGKDGTEGFPGGLGSYKTMGIKRT